MDKRILPAIAAATALALLAPAGEARAGGARIGGHIGYAEAADAESGNFLVGGSLELSILPILGAQLGVDYRHVNEYSVPTGSGEGTLDVRSVPVTVSGRLYLPTPGPSPFAEVGAGWYHVIYDYDDELEALGAEDDSENSFGWHVGAGLDLPVGPRASLVGQLRWVFVDPERELDKATFDQVEEFEYDSWYGAVGVEIRL